MRARLRFTLKPFFNFPPNKLVCQGTLVGRAEDRANWTMTFTVQKQLSELVYEGDLRWMIEPSEQDFGKGVKFKLNVSAGGKTEGKDKDRRDKVENDRHERKERQKKKEEKDDNQKSKKEKDKKDKDNNDKPKDDGNIKEEKKHKPPHGIRLREDAYAEKPPVMMGVIADGELLG